MRVRCAVDGKTVPARPLESAVERRLVSYVESVGGVAYKFSSPANRGVPDRLCLMPCGEIFFVEVKRPGEQLRALQRHVHKRLEALGARVRVWDGSTPVEEVFEL